MLPIVSLSSRGLLGMDISYTRIHRGLDTSLEVHPVVKEQIRQHLPSHKSGVTRDDFVLTESSRAREMRLIGEISIGQRR
jgi:hypothetical protein